MYSYKQILSILVDSKAYGKTIKVLERGRWKAVARADTKGRFLTGYDEAVAQFYADAPGIAVERDKLKLQNEKLLLVLQNLVFSIRTPDSLNELTIRNAEELIAETKGNT